MKSMVELGFMNFNESVWKMLEKIPSGRVTTYKFLAIALGKPNAARAVGNACKANPFPVKVPCHRVVKSDGSIGGYSRGERAKIRLLRKEGIRVKNTKILDFDDKLFDF